MTHRAIPYEDYFGPMGISETEKHKRISFAEGLEDRMLMVFALVEIYAKYNMLTQVWLEKQIYDTYRDYVAQFAEIDAWRDRHIREFAEYVSVNTFDNVQPNLPKLLRFDQISRLNEQDKTETQNPNARPNQKPTQPEEDWYEPEEDEEQKDDMMWLWYLSADRAMFIAENEANDMAEYDGYLEAIADGMTLKTWCTVGDNRARDAHAATDGQTVDIDDYFLVGDEYGLFPGDTEHLSAENTINCRCYLVYS